MVKQTASMAYSCLLSALVLAFARRAALQVVFAPAPAPLSGVAVISPDSVNLLSASNQRPSINSDDLDATLGAQFQVYDSTYFQASALLQPRCQL